MPNDSTEREMDDADLLESLARRDDHAAERFVHRYKPLLLALARRYSATANDAEDAVQDILLEVWRRASRFERTRGSATTFVATVARRRLIDRLRRSQSSPAMEELSTERTADGTSSPEWRVQIADLSSAFARLHPDHRKVLEMSLIEGYTHVEIADAMELPLGTVKTIARRGVRRVRADLHAS